MSGWLRFVITLATAFVLVLAFRALAFSVYTVEGKGLQPLYICGELQKQMMPIKIIKQKQPNQQLQILKSQQKITQRQLPLKKKEIN